MSVLMDGPVTVCQLKVEFEAVLELYQTEKPSRVLEIGTASGGSLYWFLRYAQPGATIVTVDLPVADYQSSEHLYPGWIPDGVRAHQIRGDSRDRGIVQACALMGPYQWLFVDGNHRYDNARADYENYSALVEPGGLVLLHDIALRRDYGDGTVAGVERLWRELQAEGHWTREFRSDPGQTAYGIGCIRLP